MTFVTVARSSGVDIRVVEGGFLSFSNSPYYAHKQGLAVDLYPGNTGSMAFSPVDGVIVGKYTIKSPRPKHFRAVETEQLLLIRPVNEADLAVRVLHVDSPLVIGSEVQVGTSLGSLVRSGFFDFWTENHIHVEVRSLSQPLRAKGDLLMLPLQGGGVEGSPCGHIPDLRVVSVCDSYALVRSTGGVIGLGSFTGVGCWVGENIGILDAGLPHYGFGGVHLQEDAEVKQGESVELWGASVGRVSRYQKGFAWFKSNSIEVHVEDYPIRGLSLYPWLREPLLKLIPETPSHDWLSLEGETIHLSLKVAC